MNSTHLALANTLGPAIIEEINDRLELQSHEYSDGVTYVPSATATRHIEILVLSATETEVTIGARWVMLGQPGSIFARRSTPVGPGSDRFKQWRTCVNSLRSSVENAATKDGIA